MGKTTISEYSFLERFDTEEKAVEFFEMLRWGKVRTCPSCGGADTYHHVSLKHLHRYVNEIAFRLNEGDVKNKLMDRIEALCCKMIGVRLPYRVLTA